MGLNIGVVHWAFPPVTGGVEMHLLTVCPEMVRQGATILVGGRSGVFRPGVPPGEALAGLRRAAEGAMLDGDAGKPGGCV